MVGYYVDMKPRFPRGPKPVQVVVSEKQENFLTQIANARQGAKSLATRANIILQCREYGRRNQQIAGDLSVTDQTVRFWRKRWLDEYEQLCTQESEEENHKSIPSPMWIVWLDLLPSYEEGLGEVDYPSPPAPLPLGEGSFWFDAN